MSCGVLSLTLENKVLRRICEPKRVELTGGWRKGEMTKSLIISIVQLLLG
jgi:hypothetical protein